MSLITSIILALAPVSGFLLLLIAADSYKLVRPRLVLVAVAAGSFSGLLCYLVNSDLLQWLQVEDITYRRYVAPIVEELSKGLFLWILFRAGRIGFLVDAAIFGFAIGTGFALLENIFYLNRIDDANPLLWGVRGFGTAVMHGGTTATLAICWRMARDRRGFTAGTYLLSGFAIAIGLHSLFNHFFLSPLLYTFLQMLILPLVFLAVYNSSENSLQNWLELGMDTDIELLEMIRGGKFRETRVGQYLLEIRERFPGEVVVDMLCILRINIELSTRAKGTLMLRELGYKPESDPATRARFKELASLENNIGKTGLRALAPFRRNDSRDLWELYMLERL